MIKNYGTAVASVLFYFASVSTFASAQLISSFTTFPLAAIQTQAVIPCRLLLPAIL